MSTTLFSNLNVNQSLCNNGLVNFKQERIATSFGEAVNVIHKYPDGYPIIWDLHVDPIINARFSVFTKPLTNTTNNKTYTLGGMYLAIKEPYFKKETDLLRAIDRAKAEKRYTDFKRKHFHYACFSGTFKSRANSAIIQHSGLIAIDLDKLKDLEDIKRTMCQDEYALLVFTSPGGSGLKIVFEIKPDNDPRKHEIQYRAIKTYLKLKYNLNTDDGAKDISRATLLCHDPNVFLNPLILERGMICK